MLKFIGTTLAIIYLVFVIGSIIFYIAQVLAFMGSGQFDIRNPNDGLNSITLSFGIFLTITSVVAGLLYGLIRVSE